MKRFVFVLLIVALLCGCSAKEDVEKTGVKKADVTNSDGVVIALLDTGVSTSVVTGGHLLTGYNYITDTTDTEDLVNHGTAVASVILGCESADVQGAAPDACVVPIVVVTRQGDSVVSASPETLAKAIRDSIDIYHADIINVSLGIQKDRAELSDAVEYAEEKGVLVVSAVGNDGAEGKPYYPASYPTVLAVGACDEHGEESDFSQDGADVLAQGEDIWLASKNGRTYGVRGTSFSTGFVSAEAANLLLEKPSLSSKELREIIKE